MATPLPPDKQPIVLSNTQLETMSESKTSSGSLSSSPWAKMFPSGATQEELKMFIQTFVKDLMAEVKRADDQHKKNLAEQKKQMEENS